ncbi:hypothetical protein GOQ30_05835 [Flavobacterium sp. TP390]|uniref:T9SS C-terminal target domain-containing protein n=1 Tax=Flavobacterium profundi TaxID=1774945 RepID=A0A6I4IG12_9FLAO|nr:hypothetical protein [Flavobacterium profundi]MVO08683.1 hypothetical protein [Flavobacterium profundi]
MKRNLLLLAVICNFCFASYAQSGLGISEKENWLGYWTEFNPKKEDYRDPQKILTGVISQNTTLSNRDTYLLQGNVYITNNAVLTIEPGTLLRGDSKTCGTLIITKGAKIMAEGSESFPIVFTSNNDEYSRKPGDWGGIVVMGDAPVSGFGGMSVLNYDLEPQYNRFGGENAAGSAGVLKHIRVEYAGRKSATKRQIAGITFAGVGSGTVIEGIQVSYSDNDSFEFYGGNVKAQKLVSFRAADDDFDFTQGVQAEFSNSIALRHPFSSNPGNPRCMEVKSYNEIEKFDPQRSKTNVKATNITLVNVEDNKQGLIKEAVYVSNEANLSLSNSVVYGFRDFLMLDKYPMMDEFEKFIKLKNLVVGHCTNIFSSMNGERLGLDTDYITSKNGIETSDGLINDYFKTPDFSITPDFRYLKIQRNSSNVVLNNK